MSRKKENAKKFVLEILENRNVDILNEILHPDYFADEYLTSKDRKWHTVSSGSKLFSHFLKQESPQNPNIDKGLPFEKGIEAAKKRINAFYNDESAMTPAYNIEILDIIEEEDRVMIAYTHSFIHDQQYFGIKPTNREIKHNAVRIFTFLDDKIVKMNLVSDTYQLFAEMGTIVMNHGDEEHIQQYLGLLKRQNLIP